MGYYTYHTLSMESANPINAQNIYDFAEQKGMDFAYGFDPYGAGFETRDQMKWYEHEEEMRKISEAFPDILFILHGEGEEQGDIWDEYYKRGKMQRCNAEVVIPPYNPNELT